MINLSKFSRKFSPYFILCCVCLSACRPETEIKPASEHFQITLQAIPLKLRLALTDLERSRGLMHCKELQENEGMLFVYPQENTRAFWMMNVPINLSIAYLDSTGTIIEIHEMKAQDLNSTYSDSNKIQYCLEMRENWFKKNKITPGAKLNLSELNQAIKARGFKLQNITE